ncbi:hypothetical protein DFH28DRAFT_927252 [Melampsora americana]|nr:hypothetical protein DFH28DRAFT_927252 [Melampsora americana]
MLFLETTNTGVRVIAFPNPWRVKANGMLIRSVPIALYSDDTSDNVSKKWNKHMSFYFTLAGLQQKLTNQEYNIHPLCTSNTANALEQGDQIVDKLNQAASTGFCHSTSTHLGTHQGSDYGFVAVNPQPKKYQTV